MASIVKTYADARAAALKMAQNDEDTAYICECGGVYRVTCWDESMAELEGWQFVGRVLPDGTWSPSSGQDVPGPKARSGDAGSIADSPLAGIEITRKTINTLNREADRRGLSREAYRAIVLFLACDSKDMLNQADYLVRHLDLSSIKDMVERGF